MSIEEKLKEYILAHYKSIREFTKDAGMPYSTVDGVLKRGIANSSIGNVIKICKTLNISADELSHNRIVPIHNEEEKKYIFIAEIPQMLAYMKRNPEEYNFTIDGQPLAGREKEILHNSLTLAVDFVRTWREKTEKDDVK